MIGCFLFLVSVIAWSIWFVLQAHVLKSYPAKLRFTSLQCLSSVVQCFIIAIAGERDPLQWKVGWDMRLLTVAYSGIFFTSLSHYLQLWVIHNKGPVFQALFEPLTLVITMAGSVLLSGDAIPLGRWDFTSYKLVLYAVLWGKSKKRKKETSEESLEAKAVKENTEMKETEVTQVNHIC